MRYVRYDVKPFGQVDSNDVEDTMTLLALTLNVQTTVILHADPGPRNRYREHPLSTCYRIHGVSDPEHSSISIS